MKNGIFSTTYLRKHSINKEAVNYHETMAI